MRVPEKGEALKFGTNFIQTKATEQEKQELKAKLSGRQQSINEWLDSFENTAMSAEAAAFLYMTLGIDEMQLWD